MTSLQCDSPDVKRDSQQIAEHYEGRVIPDIPAEELIDSKLRELSEEEKEDKGK